jgi:hypothetical protein
MNGIIIEDHFEPMNVLVWSTSTIVSALKFVLHHNSHVANETTYQQQSRTNKIAADSSKKNEACKHQK